MIPNASTARGAVMRGQWSASRTTGVATNTLLPIWNILMWVLWHSEVQSFVNKRNNWLAGKCYIATMLFDSCRAHTFKSSHMRLCVLFFRMVTNLILFIVSFPKSSLSHPLDSQVYLLFFTFNHCFRIYYCGKRVGGNERFRGHELRIRYYDLNCSHI